MLRRMNTELPMKLLRKALEGKTQKELAAAIGISAPYLSDILKGNRRPTGRVLAFLGLVETRGYKKATSEQPAA